MYQPRSSRLNRKNQIVVNLIQTSTGYSVLEGEDLLNKSSNITLIIPPKQKPIQQTGKSTNYMNPGQNIIIPLYPYIPPKTAIHQHDYFNLPTCADWFNINSIHQIQKKALSQWFKLKKNSNSYVMSLKQKVDKYQKQEEMYKKYRNYIVQLSKEGYVSAARARKGLAGDACTIMRIHAFLQHWGIINYSYRNQIPTKERNYLLKYNEQEKLDMFQFDKKLISRNYSQEDTQVLRRATKKYRPFCDFCSQRCGIVWFQHRRNLNSKQISNIMKNVNSKNPPLSTAEYEIILCIKCYSEGNFPIILSANDFNKASIQDKLNETKSKRKRDKDREPIDLNPQPEWSSQQILQLLELIQKHGQNWEQISKQMKNRSPEEAIQCFLTLPLKQISKIKFEYDVEQFVKQNNDELRNDFSTNICQKALQEVKFKQQIKNEIEQEIQNLKEKKQEQILFDQIVKLYLKKIELKLEQLQDWQASILKIKKDVEEGRKTVLAQKIRNLTR